MKQEVKIIGGLYKGKKLTFPEVQGLRPTPNRVRETLFNWLMHDIRGARCLDAFAGSGALGFEAFSRGAASVIFIEQSSIAKANLQKIIQGFNSPKLKVIQGDSRLYIQNCTLTFDLIFLDPPFSANYLPECLTMLAESPCLNKHGLVYTESSSAIPLDADKWQALKLKQTGDVFYGLFRKL